MINRMVFRKLGPWFLLLDQWVYVFLSDAYGTSVHVFVCVCL